MRLKFDGLIELLVLGMGRDLTFADVPKLVRSAESMGWPEHEVEGLEWALRRECRRREPAFYRCVAGLVHEVNRANNRARTVPQRNVKTRLSD